MITLQELCEHLDILLQPKLFSDFCPNGLQVEGAPAVFKIATAVSATQAVIEQAIKEEVQALIVHHGLFWNKDSLMIVGSKKNKIASLLKNNISLIAYHLPLDANQLVGNNWKAAKELGWQNLQPFLISNGQGIGVRGTFPEISVDSFKHHIEEYYQHPAACALGGKKAVRSAALVSGGAHRSLMEAVQANVDCFITGSFDEPVWHQANEEKINFFALGHHATETIGPKALLEHIKSALDLKGVYIDYENPF